MRSAGEDRAAAVGQGKQGGAHPVARDAAALEREAERLRAELAAERERVKVLEDTNSRVAARLDRAIESVKAMLARQD
jgi:predicted nuclease with TOPRIM domain